jgi:hypothetical protein
MTILRLMTPPAAECWGMRRPRCTELLIDAFRLAGAFGLGDPACVRKRQSFKGLLYVRHGVTRGVKHTAAKNHAMAHDRRL